MTVKEFREQLLSEKFEDILNNVLLNDDAVHVSLEQKDYIKNKIADKFKVPVESVRLIIVGSAKLGFSISEKKLKGKPKLPRYRAFSPTSDIDIAIVCQPIFEMIWNDLSQYSFASPYFPWQSNKFGDYLVCGWMRPDHFPLRVRLRKCDDWWDVFRFLSSRQFLGRRRIRAGLFYNFERLQNYQSKALKECIDHENLQR
jgi:hypothetical protein